MLDKLTSDLDFHTKALVLRAQRQQLLASNIANADTPGYVARDFNFRQAMASALSAGSSLNGGLTASTSSSASGASTNPKHIALGGLQSSTLASSQLGYSIQSQPSMDNNSVDLDRERANFVDNSVRYESTLRFINGQSKTMLAAIQGQ